MPNWAQQTCDHSWYISSHSADRGAEFQALLHCEVCGETKTVAEAAGPFSDASSVDRLTTARDALAIQLADMARERDAWKEKWEQEVALAPPQGVQRESADRNDVLIIVEADPSSGSLISGILAAALSSSLDRPSIAIEGPPGYRDYRFDGEGPTHIRVCIVEPCATVEPGADPSCVHEIHEIAGSSRRCVACGVLVEPPEERPPLEYPGVRIETPYNGTGKRPAPHPRPSAAFRNSACSLRVQVEYAPGGSRVIAEATILGRKRKASYLVHECRPDELREDWDHTCVQALEWLWATEDLDRPPRRPVPDNDEVGARMARRRSRIRTLRAAKDPDNVNGSAPRAADAALIAAAVDSRSQTMPVGGEQLQLAQGLLYFKRRALKLEAALAEMRGDDVY